MANRDHLLAFRKGTKFWNRWRKDAPSIKPDLSAVDLRGTVGQRADLPTHYRNLKGVNLSDANLESARLNHTDLSNADLSRANLRRANLAGARLVKTRTHLINASAESGSSKVKHSKEVFSVTLIADN
jgi:uncharacterized protein YjbI with pentapeptide repeats